MFLTSTRYALIVCRYLTGSYFENKYRSAPEIAAAFNMNVRALMPALRQLTRSGILRSRVGGKEPGFIYARHPDTITLWEVMVALEGDNDVVCCREICPNLRCDCRSKSECVIYSTFSDLVQQLKEKLKAINIEEYSVR